MRISGIYAITHELTKMVYVGASTNIKERCWAHKGKLRNGLHHNSRLQAAWKNHPNEQFTFSVLESCTAPLGTKEGEWAMKMLDLGYVLYNATEFIGDRQRHYADTRTRISRAMQGRRRDPESVKQGAAAQRGRTYTIETRAKMSAAHTGKTQSLETIARRVAALTGQVRTPEMRQRISDGIRSAQAAKDCTGGVKRNLLSPA